MAEQRYCLICEEEVREDWAGEVCGLCFRRAKDRKGKELEANREKTGAIFELVRTMRPLIDVGFSYLLNMLPEKERNRMGYYTVETDDLVLQLPLREMSETSIQEVLAATRGELLGLLAGKEQELPKFEEAVWAAWKEANTSLLGPRLLTAKLKEKIRENLREQGIDPDGPGGSAE